MTTTTPNFSAKDARRPQLQPLTSLRFVAALVVVLFHTWWQFPGVALLHAPAAVENLINAGHLGVSVFFILSGFILSWNYLGTDFRQRETLRQFWLSRFARIYPVYLLGVVVAAPKFFSTLLADAPAPAAILAESGGTALSVVTLTQAWIPQLALAWNPPGWSLSAELFFYFAFPFIAMRFALPRRTGVVIVALVLCWLAMLLPAAIYSVVQPDPVWLPVLKFNPLIRLPEFVMGMLLGKLFLDAPWGRAGASLASGVSRPGALAFLAASGATLFTLACVDQRRIYLLLHNGLLDPLFGVLIIALAGIGLRDGALNRFLSNRAFVLLGEASYALYLLHLPLKGIVQGVSRRIPGLNLDDPVTSLVVYSAYLIASVVIAILTFKFVESPARRWIKLRIARRSRGAQPAPAGPELRPAAAVLLPALLPAMESSGGRLESGPAAPRHPAFESPAQPGPYNA